MSDTITFTVARADIETALEKALLERSPYSHDEAPLLLAARQVVKDQQKAIVDLIAGQVRSLVDDAAVAAALHKSLLVAIIRPMNQSQAIARANELVAKKATPQEFEAMLDEQPYTFVGIWGGDDKLLDADGNIVGAMQLGDSYVDAAGITTQDGRRFG